MGVTRSDEMLPKSLAPVPQGRLNLAQDASPGLDLKERPSPAGTAENRHQRNPEQASAVPALTDRQTLRRLSLSRVVNLRGCYGIFHHWRHECVPSRTR